MSAVDLQLLLEAVGHTDDHVVDQCSGQTVEGTIFLRVVRALHMEDACVDFNLHLGNEVALECAFRSLDRDVVVLVNLDFNTGRYGNGCSTDSGHFATSLPYERKDFAADMLLASFLVGHDALGC